MTSGIEAHIQAVDATALTPIVLRALGCTDGELVEWASEAMRPTGGNWGPSILYRFSGAVRRRDVTLPWSLVLKVSSETIEGVDRPVGGDDTLLQREAAFYRWGLVDTIPASFRPAHCYAIDEQVGESGRTEYWFWLEDLSSSGSASWTIDESSQAAYGLGLLNGAFIDHPALPHTSWLKRDHVRGYLEHAAPQFRILFADRTTPLIRRAFPRASVVSLMAMWQSREVHLQALEQLPQTLIHGDAQRTNLFLISNEAADREVVAIDWNTVGVGPVGLDAAQLFGFSLLDWTIRADQFAEVAQRIYARYLAGIQASGWQGEPNVVRLGYTTSMLRVRAMFVMRFLQVLLDETMQKRTAAWRRASGITLEDMADRAPHIEQCLNTLFEESIVLRDQLL